MVDIFEQLFEWCDTLNIERILVDDGTWFDGEHLLNWGMIGIFVAHMSFVVVVTNGILITAS